MSHTGPSTHTQVPVHHRTARISGFDVFYREAGPHDAPVLLLLRGFPTSSNMFRHLIPAWPARFTSSRPTIPASVRAACRIGRASPTRSRT
jgi:pimeloyl-ACP methyl ester carboxylesterase